VPSEGARLQLAEGPEQAGHLLQLVYLLVMASEGDTVPRRGARSLTCR
jgi:hypothetical protein